MFYEVILKSLSKSWPSWVGIIAIVGLVAGTFRPVIGYDFVRWDDDISVTQNEMLTTPWSWELIKSFFDPQTVLRFKPLHWLVMRVMAGVVGMDPRAWHALGLVLHTGVAVALFLTLSQVLRTAGFVQDDRFTTGVSWLAAAIWAVHPLRVEPVAWVTASSYPMATLFMVCSYGAYVKAHAEGGLVKWGVASWVLAFAAYLTYPISVTFVAWLIATDAFLLRVMPEKPWQVTQADVRRWWWKHVAFAVPAGGAVGATLWTRLIEPAGWYVAPTLDDVGWIDRGIAAMAALMAFPAKLFWPVNLTPNHAHFTGSIWTLSWVVIGAAAFGCVLVMAGFWCKKNPARVWYIAGFCGLALPCVGLTEKPVWLVDRYSYMLDMVLIGALAAVVLTSMRCMQGSRAVWLVLVLVLVVVGGASRRLLPVWKNTDTLFAHMERNPDFSDSIVQKAHVYLLWYMQLMSEGRLSEGLEKLAMANETYLAAMREALRRGDPARAVFLSRLLETNIGITPEIRRERAAWLFAQNQWSEGAAELKMAAEALPRDGRIKQLQEELKKRTALP